MSESIKQTIRSFIVENFLFGDEAALPGDAESLIAGGIIDSTGVSNSLPSLRSSSASPLQTATSCRPISTRSTPLPAMSVATLPQRPPPEEMSPCGSSAS